MFKCPRAADYSAFWQQDVLSQSAHEVLSQQACAVVSQHSSQHSAAFSELLQQAHDATANIAATTAKDINTFFIIIHY